MLNFFTNLVISISLLLGLVYITNVSAISGMSEVLLKYALSQTYLNPHIWAHSSYEVQRELYLLLIQYFEDDGKLLPILCGLPKIIDIVRLLILYYICRATIYKRNSQDPSSPIVSCRNEPKVSATSFREAFWSLHSRTLCFSLHLNFCIIFLLLCSMLLYTQVWKYFPCVMLINLFFSIFSLEINLYYDKLLLSVEGFLTW